MFIEDIIVRLEARGVGTAARTIFKSSKVIIPDGDGPYLSIVSTGGATPERTQDRVTVPAYLRPTAQLVVRASTWANAVAMWQAAYDALVGVRNEFVNGVWYREIIPLQSEPIDLGQDAKGRAQAGFNVMGIKRPS